MTAATGLLVLGGVSLLATASVLYRCRRVGLPLVPLVFFTAWLQGELAVIHLIWQGALAAWLLSEGALAQPEGQLGLALLLLSFAGLMRSLYLSAGAGASLRQALTEGLGNGYRDAIDADRRGVLRDHISWREWMRPFSFRRDGITVIRSVPYGPAGRRNQLDIYQPLQPRAGGFPVLLQVHGGAWMIGNKQQQGLPLMNHLAQRGWLCVSINYRLSPRATFPDHLFDVKQALGWIRQHIHRYGGNPDFVAITGGSAGGHLSSLAALTANQPDLQPGFEQIDTSVQAAVPLYGVYDWNDVAGAGGTGVMEGLLARFVMKCTRDQNPELWRRGTSLANIHPGAPPMFLLHGSHDTLVWVEDARYFAEQLRCVSRNPVVYAELQGAQHAFEIFHSMRCDYAVNAVTEFLEWNYSQWRRSAARPSAARPDAARPDAAPSSPRAAPVTVG